MLKKSDSPWPFPIVLVKKQDNTWRMCVDYRLINNKTIKNSFPLPHIDDTLAKVGGKRFYSKIDLAQGYHQLRMHPGDEDKVAFSTSSGHYTWRVMPFGLKNAPASFSQFIKLILAPYSHFLVYYLDDILICGDDVEQHFEDVMCI